MQLIFIIAIAGIVGGLAIWGRAIYRLLLFIFRKRRIKTERQIKAETLRHELGVKKKDMLELYRIAIDAYKAMLLDPEQSAPAASAPPAAESAEPKPAKPETSAADSLQPDAKAEADALLPGWMKEPPRERKRTPAEANPDWEEAVKEMEITEHKRKAQNVQLIEFKDVLPAGQISITEEVTAGETVERC